MDNLKWWQKRKCDHRAGIRNVIFFKEKYAKKLAEFSTLYSRNITYKLDYILKFQLKKKIPRALQFVLTIFCKKSKQLFNQFSVFDLVNQTPLIIHYLELQSHTMFLTVRVSRTVLQVWKLLLLFFLGFLRL